MKEGNFTMLKRILKYAKRYKVLMLIAFLGAILYVSATLYAPKLVGDAIDQYIDSNTFVMEDILWIVLQLLIVVVLGAIFGWLMNALLNRITYSIVKDLRIDAFNKVLRVPVSYLDSHLSGDILTRIISDTDQVSEGLLQGFSQALTGIITIFVTIAMMIWIKWEIALVVIVLTPLSLFVASFISKKSFNTFKSQAQIKGDMGGFLNEMITNQKVVIAYQRQSDNIKKFKTMDQQLYEVGIKAQFNSSLTNPTTRFVNAIVYASVATIGSILIVNSKGVAFGVGGLTAFLTYASQYTKPFNEISGVATELSNSFASLRRVFELIDEKELQDEENINEISIPNGAVQFRDVSFQYTLEKPLIENLNIDIQPGMKVAIVGPTGCGKTTLINLLMRYYELTGGEILIDGKNINDYSRDSLRKKIGLVLQETWLFKGTVYENISYAKEDATLEEVKMAAKKAYADDFIAKLPNGYDTVISDDEGVSIGQKQLLCIARLMLRMPQILILDEATSNIDTRTEVMIQKAFNAMMEGRTSFIIAHRLSTIRNADKILVMKDGTIIEQGTHEELLAKNGFYKQLYESQFE
ncbi:MAG: ABC transporter ATP-binding protein/permease [Anaeroplasmataceae bacterium]|nr:ABC transporter ATP-binding protein/permease [Anaeroplasmataceae bacterium]